MGAVKDPAIIDHGIISLTMPLVKPVSYFRGREFHGKVLKVPEGYEGAILHVTDRDLPGEAEGEKEGAEEDEEEQHQEIKVAEQIASFNEFVVWGHEAVAQEAEDPYARAVTEWVELASAVSCKRKSSSCDC